MQWPEIGAGRVAYTPTPASESAEENVTTIDPDLADRFDLVTAEADGLGAGAEVCSYPRPPATVIAVRGDVDAAAADLVGTRLMGFTHLDQPLVLDLTGVAFLGPAGLRAVLRFAAACRRANLEWMLVTSPAMDFLLRSYTSSHGLPVVRTVGEAIQRLGEMPDTPWRRHCITPLASTRC